MAWYAVCELPTEGLDQKPLLQRRAPRTEIDQPIYQGDHSHLSGDRQLSHNKTLSWALKILLTLKDKWKRFFHHFKPQPKLIQTKSKGKGILAGNPHINLKGTVSKMAVSWQNSYCVWKSKPFRNSEEQHSQRHHGIHSSWIITGFLPAIFPVMPSEKWMTVPNQ